MNFYLSGTKNNAVIVKSGKIHETIATVRHFKNDPNINWINIPVITHVVPVAANMPRN